MNLFEIGNSLKPGESVTVPLQIKLRDTRSLAEQHNQLMYEILVCDNMIDPNDEDKEHQEELASLMEEMCQQQNVIEEVMFLKDSIDCNCFYA